MFERFTPAAHEVVELANQEADRLQHNYLGPEHVLVGILRQGGSRAARVLRAHGLDLEAARAEVGRLVDQGILPRPERSDTELLPVLGSTWRRCGTAPRRRSGVRRWARRPGG